MSKLIIVAGLPGSGKTHYLQELKTKKIVSFFYDDYQHKAYGYDHDPRLSRHYGPMLSKLKRGLDVAVSDILFCQKNYLNIFLKSTLYVLPDTELELVFFENNPGKAIKNIKFRGREGFVEKELKFVEENTPKYKVPSIKEIEIFSDGQR